MTGRHGSITIIGLGPGAFGQLSLAAWQALQQARTLFLRTEIHPTVSALKQHHIAYESFDALYQQADTFDEVYDGIAARIMAEANTGPVTYAVPGHPMVGEISVQHILKQAEEQAVEVQLIPSMSALDAIFAAARLDPTHGIQVFDALDFKLFTYIPAQPTLFLQVYDQQTASQLKLALLEEVSPDHHVLIIRAAGVPGEETVASVPLHQLDRVHTMDHLTSVYVPAYSSTSPGHSDYEQFSLAPLVKVMERLRGADGCPWDRKQTHTSLKRYLIEEAYEVLDAIDADDTDSLCEELGDVLLQVVFHAQLGTEAGTFHIDDVVQTITTKMIRRHPHVFSDVKADDVSTVLRNWEAIKRAEKAEQGKPERDSVLDGVPRHLPALMHAEQVQKKAARVGFEWDDVSGAMGKVMEEAGELQEALVSGNSAECFAELGDLLFAIVNVARYLQIDPEAALRGTTDKFIRRFRHIEHRAAASHRNLTDMTLEEMDRLWDEAKILEHGGSKL